MPIAPACCLPSLEHFLVVAIMRHRVEIVGMKDEMTDLDTDSDGKVSHEIFDVMEGPVLLGDDFVYAFKGSDEYGDGFVDALDIDTVLTRGLAGTGS